MIPVLPFTAEVMDSLRAGYLAALWPLSAVAALLSLLAAALVRGGSTVGGRAAAALLAIAWATVGIGFQIHTAGRIDFMAPVYGGFFLLQAALMAWAAVARPLAGGPRPGPAGGLGLALVVLAVVGWPALALATGRAWTALPAPGLTPDATALLTLGLLLLAAPPARLSLLAVPVLWAMAAGMQALSLDTPARLILPAAALLAVAVAFRDRRGPKP